MSARIASSRPRVVGSLVWPITNCIAGSANRPSDANSALTASGVGFSPGPLPAKATEFTFRDVPLTKGEARLETWVQTTAATAGATYVEVTRK